MEKKTISGQLRELEVIDIESLQEMSQSAHYGYAEVFNKSVVSPMNHLHKLLCSLLAQIQAELFLSNLYELISHSLVKHAVLYRIPGSCSSTKVSKNNLGDRLPIYDFLFPTTGNKEKDSQVPLWIIKVIEGMPPHLKGEFGFDGNGNERRGVLYVYDAVPVAEIVN